MESEEGERRVKPTKKRKRAETEEQRDQAPTLVSDEGGSSERGGVEANHTEKRSQWSLILHIMGYQLELELRKE